MDQNQDNLGVRALRNQGRYKPSPALEAALKTTILLGQPLLLTGEPGIGKSEFARWAAQDVCGHDNLLRFDVKSTTTARELFYQIDNIERFHYAHERRGADGSSDINPLAFIHFNALGEAIIRSNPFDEVSDLAARLDGPAHKRATRTVVLIDEIDKAPRDVPNDILREIDEGCFRIVELSGQRLVTCNGQRPIVIMTSNAERSLPDPFLRRCTFFHIEPPDRERLAEIVEARLSEFEQGSPFVRDVIAVYEFARRMVQGQKKPSVAELLALILALKDRGYDPNKRLKDESNWQDDAKILLLKSTQDQQHVGSRFDTIDWV